MAAPNQIFPHEIAQYSVEKHFQEYDPRSRIVYLTILGIVFVAFLLLFIIRVDVSVHSAGLIRPLQERTDIRSPVEGTVDSMLVSENAHVEAGQLLMKIHSQAIDEKSMALGSQYNDVKAQVQDLTSLIEGKDSVITSELYQQQRMLYQQKLNDARAKVDLASKNYNRYSSLAASRVISAAEFDKYDFEMKSANNELKLVREQQFSQWQGDLARLSQQLKVLEASKTQYKEQQALYEIKAPVSGSVQQLSGVQRGSYVTPSQMLGEISPDSGLIVETNVLPKDIGLVSVGSKVRMQVDAFDYNSWGMLTGVVESISGDVFNTDNGQLFFKVRCKLDNQKLKLRNGVKGTLKKGMTVQARFIVTRRSLFQLLYDSTEDWLDPNKNKHDVKKNA